MRPRKKGGKRRQIQLQKVTRKGLTTIYESPMEDNSDYDTDEDESLHMDTESNMLSLSSIRADIIAKKNRGSLLKKALLVFLLLVATFTIFWLILFGTLPFLSSSSPSSLEKKEVRQEESASKTMVFSGNKMLNNHILTNYLDINLSDPGKFDLGA
eukprot:CAMPEP_0114991828 /NCGR_PEP_ID=MMETSP0216-20121206/11592_1 /TAXON_ID=223996 /ORGANISM="Protocruzia adherens, Strain Boccale" /LENGTH=155 /DNA_ID=CAMNT_0002355205 /DNA_START=181 /DNA_END=648 /DNA_ORIENTATION=+